MNGVRILFILCMVVFDMRAARVMRVGEFQFQCYGERTLCMYPDEYCSSDSRKCVDCSTEICSDIEDIPKACRQKCGGGGEQHQTSWFMWFIVVSMVATTLLPLNLYKVVQILRKWFRTRRNNGQNDLSVGSSDSMETGTSRRSSPELKRLVHPVSEVDEGSREEHYCERKLKNVNPSQNPNSEYKPTPSTKGMSPVQSFTSSRG